MNTDIKKPIVATILAGGSGTRLWPLSTKNRPKQLLSIDNNQTLLENTIHRAQHITEKWHIVTAKAQQSFFSRYAKNLITEPASKNTAAALLLSALKWNEQYPDAIVCSFPADHTIKDNALWHQSILNAVDYVQLHNVPVLLGIKPHYPASWYGYILHDNIRDNAFKINKFVEKPSSLLAAEFLQQGNVFWNSGILITPISTLIDAFKNMHPQLYSVVSQYVYDNNESSYTALSSLSLDHALLENGYCSTVLELQGEWSDVGNFETFHAAQKIQTSTILLNAEGNTVISSKPTVLVDVHDLHIIETDTVLLIMQKKGTHSMPDIIEKIRSYGLEHLL